MPGLTWIQTSSLPVARYAPGFLVTNTHAYCVAGSSDGTTAVNTVYYATRNVSTGALGTWTSYGSMSSRIGPTIVKVTNPFDGADWLYAIGGVSSGSTTILNTIGRKKLLAGVPVDTSAWTTTGTLLNPARYTPAIYFDTSNSMFCIIGGTVPSGSEPRSMQRLIIADSSGGLTTSGTSSVTLMLPAARDYASAIYHNNHVYIVGGTGTGASNILYMYRTAMVATTPPAFTVASGVAPTSTVVNGAYHAPSRSFWYPTTSRLYRIGHAPLAVSSDPISSIFGYQSQQGYPISVNSNARFSFQNRYIYMQYGTSVYYADVGSSVGFAGIQGAGGMNIGQVL